MDAPIFHQVLSAGEWRRPKPEFPPPPQTIHEMMMEEANARSEAGLDWDEPWPHDTIKKTPKTGSK